MHAANMSEEEVMWTERFLCFSLFILFYCLSLVAVLYEAAFVVRKKYKETEATQKGDSKERQMNASFIN